MKDFIREIDSKKIEDYYYFTKPELGVGLFGTVYKAKHKNTGNLRAIKKIAKSQAKNGDLKTLLNDVVML
jgi:serine/threonine protein kinase